MPAQPNGTTGPPNRRRVPGGGESLGGSQHHTTATSSEAGAGIPVWGGGGGCPIPGFGADMAPVVRTGQAGPGYPPPPLPPPPQTVAPHPRLPQSPSAAPLPQIQPPTAVCLQGARAGPAGRPAPANSTSRPHTPKRTTSHDGRPLGHVANLGGRERAPHARPICTDAPSAGLFSLEPAHIECP